MMQNTFSALMVQIGMPMKTVRNTNENLTVQQQEELTANKYVLRCFVVLAVLLSSAFIFNLLGIYIIDQRLMLATYLPALAVLILVLIISRFVPLYDRKTKYIILTGIILDCTIISVFVTYHAVLLSL